MYIGVLYCVEDVGFGIGEINFYFIVVRKIVVFCLKKKLFKMYIYKFKYYFFFNKNEEIRIYISRVGLLFYNVKMIDFNDNMGE